MPLGGEPFGVGGLVEHHLHILADGEPVMFAESCCEPCHAGVVRVGLALHFPCRLAPRGASRRDLVLPRFFPLLVVGLSAREGPLGRLMGSLVSLAAAKNPA